MAQNLVTAARSGNVSDVKQLIDEGADINAASYMGTPIACAAKKGAVAVVELLIEAGADVDAGGMSHTPLTEALEQQNDEVALLLLRAGANAQLTPSMSRTVPIALAAMKSSRAVIDALIDGGAAVDVLVEQVTLNRKEMLQQTGQMLQAGLAMLETAEEAIAQLEDDHADDDPQMTAQATESVEIAAKRTELARANMDEPLYAYDVTPLILAARCGNNGAVQGLLVAGANPDSKDGEGFCAYEWAAIAGHESVLETLRNAGVTGPVLTPEERLIRAVEQGNGKQVTELIQQGADVNTADQRRKTRYYTPLMLAVEQGNVEIVDLLLSADADVNQSDRGDRVLEDIRGLLMCMSLASVTRDGHDFDNIPLTCAAKVGNLQLVQKLIAAGSQVNYQNILGYTALFLACEAENMAIAQALIDAGADVNLRNVEDESTLFTPAAHCNLSLMELLVANQVDVNALSREGESALIAVAGATQTVSLKESDPQLAPRTYRDGGIFEERPFPDTQVLNAVNLLLEAGADPNLSNGEDTPLRAAAIRGYVPVIQSLLDAGAEIKLDQEDNALEMAELFDQHEALELLKRHLGDHKWVPESEREEADQGEEEDRWGEDLPIPDFSEVSKDPNYQAAVKDLGEMCGSKPVLMDDDMPGCFSIHVSTSKISEINTEEIQEQFLERGYFVYEPGNYSYKGIKKLVILPTNDKYQAIALHQTNGTNYGVGPGYIVQWLKQLEVEQPFVLTSIRYDLLSGRFLTPVKEPEKLAQSMFDLCPDVVDQGCGSLENLARILREKGQLYFWWD